MFGKPLPRLVLRGEKDIGWVVHALTTSTSSGHVDYSYCSAVRAMVVLDRSASFEARKEDAMHDASPAISLLGMALVFSGLVFSQESPEEAIRGRVRQYEAAYNAGDAEALAAIYTADGTHTYALGFTHRGRLEIANGLKEQFAGPFKGSRMAITPLHIRPLSPNVAVEEASFALSGLKDANGTALPAVTGLCLAVYQKEGDQWFAAAVQCMVPPPTGGSGS